MTERIGNPIGLRLGGGATTSGRVYTTWCSKDEDRTTNAVEWELATTATDWWYAVHCVHHLGEVSWGPSTRGCMSVERSSGTSLKQPYSVFQPG